MPGTHVVTPDVQDPSKGDDGRRSLSGDSSTPQIPYASVGDANAQLSSSAIAGQSCAASSNEFIERNVEAMLPSNDEELNIEEQAHAAGAHVHYTRVRLMEIGSKISRGATVENLVFASRVSLSVTMASLFLLVFPPSKPWEYGIWIYVTCVFISWQPTLDAGTAFKKFIERIAGTMIGAVLAFAVGYASISIGNEKGQAVFLGFAFAVEGFFFPFLSNAFGFRNSYGALIGNLTFGIALYGFYVNEPDFEPWLTPLYRVANVMIGSAIVAVASLVVYPVSTITLLVRLVTDLISATGQNTDMILQAASESFLRGMKPRPVTAFLSTDVAPDPVHKSYVKNLESWKSCRLLIPILKYDPWFWMKSKSDRDEFRHAMHVLTARTFRIQMNAVLMDSILRSDAEYRGPVEAIGMLTSIGRSIKTVMNVKEVDLEVRKEGIRELLEEYLPQVQSHVFQALDQSPTSGRSQIPDFSQLESIMMSGNTALPFSVLNQQGGQTLLFFQLMEQLILRVAKLHYLQLQYHPLTIKGTYVGCSI